MHTTERCEQSFTGIQFADHQHYNNVDGILFLSLSLLGLNLSLDLNTNNNNKKMRYKNKDDKSSKKIVFQKGSQKNQRKK